MFLVLGVMVGLLLGAIPGLAGVPGLAILIPLSTGLETGPAIALLLGMLTATTATDSIPAILFGLPGTAGAQATIIDGHAMALKGEGAEALGATYSAQMLGGLFSAAILALSIPVLRPVVLAFASPEFFMLGVLGVTMVAVLSRGAAMKGIAAAAVGLLFASVGRDPMMANLRWTFDSLYLVDGIPLVPLALGLFALPEVAGLVATGSTIAQSPPKSGGIARGIRSTLSNWFLVLRSSALGCWLGALPGIGIAMVDWLAYAQAMQTCRGAKETFGKGDVRGVIAPESAVSAKDAGSLIPTLAFGIPGSASMALMLSAFHIHGVAPGVSMFTTSLDVTYTVIWILVLSSVTAGLMVLALGNAFAKVATMNLHFLVPTILVLVFFAVFQSSQSLWDVVLLLFFGALGWAMKSFRWPRPPLLLGFVLGPILERFYSISLQAYGFSWVFRPMVIIIIAVSILGLYFGIRTERKYETGEEIEEIKTPDSVQVDE